MGGALAKGWLKCARSGKADIAVTVTARTQKTLDAMKAAFPEVKTSLNNAEAVAEADVVVVAVKPWLVDEVMAPLADIVRDKMVISVAATAVNACIDVYAMPNIAAEYGEGMTFINKEASKTECMAKAAELLGMVGKVKTVSQREFNAGNMLAGCGIAYVMRFIHAMMGGGVELGLYPADAQEIAMQAMTGAVAVLENSKMHPAAAIDKVTTPGGMTIKGLNELDNSGFNSAVVKCLKAGLK